MLFKLISFHLSTAVKNVGASSIVFGNLNLNGTIPDSIRINNDQKFVIGYLDFTIESWVYVTDLTKNVQTILDTRDSDTANAATLAIYNSVGAAGVSNAFVWNNGVTVASD